MATVQCVNHVGTNRSSQLTSGSGSFHLLPHYNIRLYTMVAGHPNQSMTEIEKAALGKCLTYQLPINADIIPHTVGELGECELYT